MSEKKLFTKLTNANEILKNLLQVIANTDMAKGFILNLRMSDGTYTKAASCKGAEFLTNNTVNALFKDLEAHGWMTPVFFIDYVASPTNNIRIIELSPDPNGIGYDIVIGSGNNNHKEADAFIIPFADSFYKFFNITTRFDLACEKILPEEKALLDARQTSINALQDASKNILVAMARKNEEWHDKFLEYENELNEQYKNKDAKLEEKFNIKDDKFKAEKEAFEKEKAAFNTSENKRVRRDLLERIERVIVDNKAIKLSDSTEQKGKHVIGVCIGLAVVSLLISITFIILFILSLTNYLLLIPASSFFVVFLSTMIYFIRWYNHFFRMHADAELSNKKFETDMLRAGWLAEMYFEWEEKKGIAFPQQMVESFTRNLFENNTNTEKVTHPLEYVIKVANKFNKFEFGKSGIKLENSDIKK